MAEAVEKSAVGMKPVGPYALIERLPPEGAAESFVARREGTTQLVILKRLRAAHRGKRPEESRFARESEVAMCLDHPNLIVGLDSGEVDGVAYVVTELIVGYLLRTVLSALAERNEGLPFDHFVTVADAVLRGLHHAHTAQDAAGRPLGIVHRDLSPDNILITPGGEVRIKDFALVQARTGEFKTALGISVGNAPYLSPEQARGYPLDGRSDLYTLGVTFYELLTGRRVVVAKDLCGAIRSVLEDRPPSLRFERGDIPPAVDEVIRVATAKSARDRYEHAEAMRKALLSSAGRNATANPRALGLFLRSLLPEQEARVGGMLDAARGKSLGISSTSDGRDRAHQNFIDLEPYGSAEVPPQTQRLALARDRADQTFIDLEPYGTTETPPQTSHLALARDSDQTFVDLEPYGTAEARAQTRILALARDRADQTFVDLDPHGTTEAPPQTQRLALGRDRTDQTSIDLTPGGVATAAPAQTRPLAPGADRAEQTSINLTPGGAATEAPAQTRPFTPGQTVRRAVTIAAQTVTSTVSDGVRNAPLAMVVALALALTLAAFAAGRLSAPPTMVIRAIPAAATPPRPTPERSAAPEQSAAAERSAAPKPTPEPFALDPPPFATLPPDEALDEEPPFDFQSVSEGMTRAQMFAQLAAIDDDQEYADAFMQLHAALYARAGRLPADQRRAVRADLEVAKRNLDVKGLERILARLPKGRLWPP